MEEYAVKLETLNSENTDKIVEWYFCDTWSSEKKIKRMDS